MDTLLQMGRWFGYRPGYLDLCRIFTTEDLYLKFKAISFSAENLASQFDDMNISKSRPDEFGLKIATNPDILISARNKIRTGADYSSDFSNKLTQTRLLDADPEIVEENYQAVNQFLSSLDEYRLDKLESGNKLKYIPAEEKAGKFYWVGVPGERVAQFFGNFQTSKYATKASSKLIKDYIDTMREYNGLIDWTVCLCGTTNKNKSSKIATESKYGPIEVNGITRNLEDKNDSRITNKISEGTTRDLQVLTSFGDEELDYTSNKLYDVGANVKRIYSSEKYNNLDIYQINSTYYSALGNDDASYLLSRVLQCFAPGIPQIYYVGLLAGENDIKLLESSKEGRNINRHYYTVEEIDREVERPVVKQLINLLRFRNTSKAFDLEGSFEVETPSENTIVITRKDASNSTEARLEANLETKEFTITEQGTVVTF